ncbi:hypothetical protein SAMN05660642_04628 [Geodermatophilus siccatus]|uniref:TTHB210-like domain-containing protein n=1 Tax=Geodermatophilus siccatus TaxID=1137991 RepID=A0A1H0AMY6_9ACTN|nr:DUF5602 domain-containing protein [Geodermatophilus siccatus]SDN34837.1 hypothetical protein SAMN05660642_04628 [Geodermatophilus siccatus]
MRVHRPLRNAVLTAAVTCSALSVLTGCRAESARSDTPVPASAGDTVVGPSQGLGNGHARTYVTLDGDGRPTEVGVRLSSTALEGLPESGSMLMLDLPDQAATTAFDHVMLNWNPQGHHPVELFGKPHFDFHFDMVDMAAMHGITPDDPGYAAKAEHLPEARYMPEDYEVPKDVPVAAQAVPGMGVHWFDASDTSLVPGTYDFQHIVLNGSWDGRRTFDEPMITKEFLMSGPDVELPLKQPQAFQKSAYYPTTYAIDVDEQTGDYVVSLAGMTARTAS